MMEGFLHSTGPRELALVAVVFAVALVLVTGITTVRHWLTLWRKATAAEALIGAHTTELGRRSALAATSLERLSAGMDQVASGVDRATPHVRALWLVARLIPEERARLRREVLELVLPERRRRGIGGAWQRVRDPRERV